MRIVESFGRLTGHGGADQSPARSVTCDCDHRRRSGAVRVLLLSAFMSMAGHHAQADQIRGLVTIGMQRVFEEVRPEFETASGRTLDVQFASTANIGKRIQAGEAADFIILARTAADSLIKSGLVPATDCFVLGGSPIAVAVPAGRPKPDVSSAERLKRALLAANAVAYTNPASGGPSGIQFAKVLEHLGIAEEVRPQTKFPPPWRLGRPDTCERRGGYRGSAIYRAQLFQRRRGYRVSSQRIPDCD
jgi:ABC-type molybdate transport system substrate-binding protein